MFVGKALHSVNKDGRVSVPSKMRDVIKKKYDPEDLYLIFMPGNISGSNVFNKGSRRTFFTYQFYKGLKL